MRQRAANIEVFRLRVSLEEIEPPIWRTLLVKGSTTLDELHRIIQALFQWYDYHLYRFEIRDRAFEAPDEEAEGEDASRVKLNQLELRPGESFHYTYDFGDDWRHLVEVVALEKSDDPDWLPCVLDGARRGPPEDCGGPHHYSEIQKFAQRPLDDLDEEERSTVQWLGDGFDPEEFSLAQARHDLLLMSAWGGLKRKR